MLSNRDLSLDELDVDKPRVKFDFYYAVVQTASTAIGFIADIKIPYVSEDNQALSKIVISVALGILFVLIRFLYERLVYFNKLELNFDRMKQYAKALEVRLSMSKRIYSLNTPSRILIDVKEAVLQNQAIIIKLEKTGSISLGDEIIVYDQENDNVVGEYKVTSSNNTYWIASPNGEVDPVWLGYYISQGLPLVTLSAFIVAFKK